MAPTLKNTKDLKINIRDLSSSLSPHNLPRLPIPPHLLMQTLSESEYFKSWENAVKEPKCSQAVYF